MNQNILVVDDDAEVRKTLSSILLKEGYLVETAENGKEALRASEKSRFDAALIDIKLPDMEGTELLHRLEEKQPHMVKIIVTGFPTLENAMKTVNEGADGYILKPLDIEKLLEMIKKHLTRRLLNISAIGWNLIMIAHGNLTLIEIMLNGNPSLNNNKPKKPNMGFPYHPLFLMGLMCWLVSGYSYPYSESEFQILVIRI